MVMLRDMEMKMLDIYAKGVVPGHTHSGVGQEGTFLGVLATKKDGDFWKPVHRMHTLPYVMGMDEDAYWGKRFVTARGWSDLSDMISLYKMHGIGVDELLVGQYLQDEEVAGNFSVYYNLYRKYRTDYQVDAILEGREPEEIRERPRLTCRKG